MSARTIDQPVEQERSTPIVASWVDVSVDKKTISQKQWHLAADADSSGNYALCGIPISTGVRMRATKESSVSGQIDLDPLDHERIRRRDLLLAVSTDVDSLSRGFVTGVVTSERGAMPDVRILADGVAEVRTGADGRFLIRGLAAGTQQIEAQAIGFAPATVIVDVVPRDTVSANLNLSKVTVLDSVKVTARSLLRQRLVNQFIERRKEGIGYFRDSTTIGKANTLQQVFADLPVTTRIGRGGVPTFTMQRCPPAPVLLWIDGFPAPPDRWPGLLPEGHRRGRGVHGRPGTGGISNGQGIGSVRRCRVDQGWLEALKCRGPTSFAPDVGPSLARWRRSETSTGRAGKSPARRRCRWRAPAPRRATGARPAYRRTAGRCMSGSSPRRGPLLARRADDR